ncbi:MAG: OsmC family protein [Ghiorsea sp.]|nr:OsmC family protein [Ghiorsea sp.]
MARLKAVFEGGSRFTVACRSHSITIDQPKDNGGEDMGMTPPEIMASSLASCIGFYVARYCEQAKIDATGLTVSCDWQVGGKPKHMESFDVQVALPNFPEKRRKAIERVAQSCLIHATLGETPEVRVSLV